MPETNVCMFCLCETPLPIKYDGPCECKPYLHKRCLTTWFKKTPNECPLCRKDYDPISDVDEQAQPEPALVVNRGVVFIYYNEKMKYIFCLIVLLYASVWLELF
jgi:hypothetical protein